MSLKEIPIKWSERAFNALDTEGRGFIYKDELLNHIKEQMKETINYYQKLYESSMAFAMRKVLREQKKKKRLELREQVLQNEINELQSLITEKEKDIEQRVIAYD